jgi:hypothetical protein
VKVKETSRSVSEKKIVIREPHAAVTYLIEALRHTDASDSTAAPPSSVRASAAHAPVRHCGRPRPALWALLQRILRPPARRRSRPRPAPPSAPPPSSWTRSCNAPCRLPPRVRIRPSASIRSRSGSSHGPWRLGIGEKTEASLNSTVWDRNKSTPPDHRPLRFYNPPLANNQPPRIWDPRSVREKTSTNIRQEKGDWALRTHVAHHTHHALDPMHDAYPAYLRNHSPSFSSSLST